MWSSVYSTSRSSSHVLLVAAAATLRCCVERPEVAVLEGIFGDAAFVTPHTEPVVEEQQPINTGALAGVSGITSWWQHAQRGRAACGVESTGTTYLEVLRYLPRIRGTLSLRA
jgi:hypothetical protein